MLQLNSLDLIRLILTAGAEVSKQQVDSNPVKEELSAALLAQQLPPLPKYNGNSDDESFQEWIAQFELVAEVCKWNPQAKLIHLTTRLRGEAFLFYRSYSKSQKADYDQMVKELTRRFTPVRIPSVQTSLFHERKQGEQESVDSYAQDLKSKFHKDYPQASQGDKAWDGRYSHCSSLLDSFPLLSRKWRVPIEVLTRLS